MRTRLRPIGRLDAALLALLVGAAGYAGYRIVVHLDYAWNWAAMPQFLFRYDADGRLHPGAMTMPEPLSSDHSRSEPRPTEARLLNMVFPDNTNHLGTLFGGQALAWMDMSAFIAASRYARTTVVTARSEQVDFNLPIHKGDLVEVVARVV